MACVLALPTALLVCAAPAQATKKPDLVVRTPTGIGKEYAFQGRLGNASFVFTTKNKGDARAGHSVTRVQLDHADKQFKLGDAGVARLQPGKAASDAVPGLDDSPLRFDYPLGAYVPEVCADATDQVRESDEFNNCEFVTDPDRFKHFYVAAPTWAGSLSGTAPLSTGGGDAIERWSSTDASYDFDEYHGQGAFLYDFGGHVKWTDSGTDAGGCSRSGSGTRNFGAGAATARGELSVSYLHRQYLGEGAADRAFYKYTVTCNGLSFQLDGPFNLQFWSSGIEPKSLPFGTTALHGSAQSQGLAGTITWIWNLAAP